MSQSRHVENTQLSQNILIGVILLRWGSFANGLEGFEELDAVIAYRLGLKTWANWVDSTVNPNTTRVFFTTMSPTHVRYSRFFPQLSIT